MTIIGLSAAFDKAFQGVDFAFFMAFMTVFCQGQGPRTITQAQQSAVFERNYSRFWNFLDGADFDDDQIYELQVKQLAEHGMKTVLCGGRKIIVAAVDDTLNRRPFGPELFGTQTHHDHAAKEHQSTYALGQNQVLFGVVPDARSEHGARCFLIDNELYLSESESEEANKDTLPFETRHHLAGLMMERYGHQLQDEEWLYVLCDAWYTKNPFLNWTRKRDRTHIIGRLQLNRVLYELPEPKEPGTPGRPRKYGERWDWSQVFEEEAVEVEQFHYGQKRRIKYIAKKVRITKFEDSVLVVAARYSDVKNSSPVLFLCTDTDLDPAAVVELYSARFSEEEAIKDMRQVLGWGTERVRGKRRWLRYMRMMLLASCWLRMIAESQDQITHERIIDPWRKKQPRLTLGQVQQALRYESWSGEQVFRHSGSTPELGEIQKIYHRAITPTPKGRSPSQIGVV
jgi:hypothetical protein